MYLSVQKLHPSAKLPLRATKDSAGCDLYACLDKPLTIAPGEIAKIPTGLAIAPSRKDIAICIFPVPVCLPSMALPWQTALAWWTAIIVASL